MHDCSSQGHCMIVCNKGELDLRHESGAYLCCCQVEVSVLHLICLHHVTMQAVQAVLQNGTESLFTQQMLNPDVLNSSVGAVAYASDFEPFPGDSFAEQVADYTASATDTGSKVPLGVVVGVSVAGAAILAVTATLTFYIMRQKKQNKQYQVITTSQNGICT